MTPVSLVNEFANPALIPDAGALAATGKARGREYREGDPFPHIVMDDFFDPPVLDSILKEFPTPDTGVWRQYYHDNSRKLALTDESRMGSGTRSFFHALNSGPFLSFLEELTGIPGLLPDPHLNGGGLHLIQRGGFLKVHADFNWEPRLKLDRRLNLLLYLNKDWKDEYGGHLELWDGAVKECRKQILPVFNRCVIFSTTDRAFHGHPRPLDCPDGFSRKSLALYYYTNGRPPEEVAKPHSTLYRDTQSGAGNHPIRSALRSIKSKLGGAVSRLAGSRPPVGDGGAELGFVSGLRDARDFVGAASKTGIDTPELRRSLARRFARIHGSLTCAHQEAEMLVLADAILRCRVDGPIVELGCFKGGSTAKLSLVAEAARRPLIVCDTFEGLPAPSEKDRSHRLTDGRMKGYAQGDYRGAYEEVLENVSRWGAAGSCRFVRGLFSETLPRLEEAPAVVFMDVDLIDSARDAFRHLWPKLGDGAKFFTHEATSIDFIRGILDPAWWHETMRSCPPLPLGAGFGFGAHARNLACLMKAPPVTSPRA